jgi:lipoate-protein ligase A
MRQWRLIYDCPTCGPRNMAQDEAILIGDFAQPTLRVYAWKPFCLSLGYGQRAADVDVERLLAHKWDIVRRPTGGRAILHGDEFTYSLVLPAGHPLAAGSVVDSYRRISRTLVTALEYLGAQTEADQRAERVRGGAVCFETPSHYEVTVHGRKLIGSAQLRREAGILQHGSLPLIGDIARICDVLDYPDESSREGSRDQVRARAITLNDALDSVAVTWQQVADAIVRGFADTFAIELIPGELTQAEQKLAEQLVAEKYDNPEWTFRR